MWGMMMGKNKNSLETRMNAKYLAEAVRFELTEDSHPRQFSRLLHSTALPRFQVDYFNRRHLRFICKERISRSAHKVFKKVNNDFFMLDKLKRVVTTQVSAPIFLFPSPRGRGRKTRHTVSGKLSSYNASR